MKESEMIQMLLGPIADELGMTRATAALDTAKPVMEALTALVNGKQHTKDSKEAQAIMDTFRLVELWCKAIREISDRVEGDDFPEILDAES